MKHVVTATVYDKRGIPISSAQNSYIKTHPLMARAAKEAGQAYRIYLHAEVAALVKADWSRAHSMFVSRFDRTGRPVNATPCVVCQRVIKMAGIKKVRHT